MSTGFWWILVDSLDRVTEWCKLTDSREIVLPEQSDQSIDFATLTKERAGLGADKKRDCVYRSYSYPSVKTIWVMPSDSSTGDMGERREFVSMEEVTGRPDRAALDRDGNDWIVA